MQEGEFPGLIPLMESYLSNVDVDIDTRCTISQYLKLISRRASGEWLTQITKIVATITVRAQLYEEGLHYLSDKSLSSRSSDSRRTALSTR